jgi:hypothetical protein
VDGKPRNPDYTCEHIALGADSALVIWSDVIEVPGWTVYQNRMTPPPSTSEWYGDLNVDPELKDAGTNMLFFTGTDRGGSLVLGRVNDAGDVFEGQSLHLGNGFSTGTFNPFAWRRTSADCPAPVPATEEPSH